MKFKNFLWGTLLVSGALIYGNNLEEILKEPKKTKELLYEQAIQYYNTHNYIGALEIFNFLGNYKESSQYLEKIKKFFQQPSLKPLKGQQPIIRILIAENFTQVFIYGKVNISDVTIRDKATIVPDGKTFLYSENGKRYFKVTVKSTSMLYKTTFSFKNKPSQTYTVLGELKLQYYKGKPIAVLYIPLELYLRGVLPKEVYTYWPLEMLKAQAIASRTFALYNILKNTNLPYDVSSSTVFQAFSTDIGYKSIDKAIKETAGLIITYKKKPIYAMYSAHNGGCIQSFKENFGIDIPYLVSKKDPYTSQVKKYSHWEKSIEAFNVKNIQIQKRNSCGGAKLVKFFLKNGSEITLPAVVYLRFQLRLKSNLFQIKKEDSGKFTFLGRGFGHGLGMSQWGAYYMAKKGFNYTQILHFYYPNTQILKAY
jgi:stage II sporulation protein D